jgi:alpha-glucan phosphorylase-like protein
VKPDIYHLNEGHAAFAGLARIRNYVEEEHLTYPEAIEVIRASSLFTTHTPIGAGHDMFSEELLRSYLSHYPGILNFPWDQIMDLGRENIHDRTEKFSMTNLAMRLSQEVNGVSRLHEKVSRKMFSPLWKGYGSDELFISHVTNGVHLPSWTAPEWKELYVKIIGDGIPDAKRMEEQISHIADVSREKMFSVKRELKKRLIAYLKRRLNKSLESGLERPQTVFDSFENLKEDTMILGFARRFINYKRANLIFSDPAKLSALLNNKDRPVILLIAGKAHPNDKEGQEMLRKTIEIFEWSDLASKVIFLVNYDMEVAKMMVQGVDVWLNTPVRMLEACGTSGMKATLNGTLNLSVLDGWWEEAYQEGTGWALSAKQIYTNREDQDELDAETIYSLLEDDIIPMYYNRNESGVPEQWMRRVQKSIAGFGMHFTASRMIEEYHDKFYNKLFERSHALTADKYKLAKQIADWKTEIAESWSSIDIKDIETYDFEHHELPYGTKFQTRIILDPGKLSLDDLGIELVFARRDMEGELEIKYVKELEARRNKGRDVEFVCDFIPDLSGAYQYGFRLYPKNKLLPHRQDFGLVKWI